MVDGKVAFSKNVAKILYIEHKYLQITVIVLSHRRPLDLGYVGLCLKKKFRAKKMHSFNGCMICI